ncbi:MAG: serine hydrolase [Chitinophagia bacterium]|nr:serine hydrolase [Chitinophagia bacterium]
MKKVLIYFICLLPVIKIFAQQKDKKLETTVSKLIEGFNGQIGVYVKSLKTGKTISINGDTVFPTASIVKVPILIGIMDRINKNELNYHQKLVWYDTLNYDPGEDIVAYLKPQTEIELSKVMMLMMTISDNTGSLWLQRIAGTGTRINNLLDSMGYHATRVNSRTPGREATRAVFGWGQTTPNEMGKIFEDIVNGKIINKEVSDKMLRIMSRQYWDEEALSSIPPTVFVASKNGAVNASRSEVLYVNGKHPYIFSVFTKNNKDISWEHDNEAWQLTRKLSKLLWDYFNE